MRINKISTILKREYLLVTRKKLFWIVSIAGPLAYLLLIVGLGAMLGGITKGQKVRVYDGAGLGEGMKEMMARESITLEVLPHPGGKVPTDALETRDVDVIIAIPPELKAEPADKPADKAAGKPDNPLQEDDDGDKPRAVLYTRKGGNMQVRELAVRSINEQLHALWLAGRGMDSGAVKTVFNKRVKVTHEEVVKGGKTQASSELGAVLICLFSVMLVMMPSLIWGMELMRSIIEEKNQRIVEILISSLTPFELLTGKLFGIGMVGFTQLGIWLVLFAGITAGGLSMLPPGALKDLHLENVLHPMMLPVLLMFFALSFLMYALPFAAVGSAVNTEKEAQQFVTPIMLLMMLPMMMMSVIMMAPDAPRVVVMSMIPIYSPMLLMMRYALGTLPLWQGALGVALTLATLFGALWICAKVYRVGILMYGQKPGLAEIIKWIGRS